jgi:ferritin
MFKFLFGASKKAQANNLRRPEENIPEPAHELKSIGYENQTVTAKSADLIKFEIRAKDMSAEN